MSKDTYDSGVDLSDAKAIVCQKCGVPLEIGTVRLSYLGSSFPVNLPRCPQCGLAYIPEELALGRISQVEKSLEDK